MSERERDQGLFKLRPEELKGHYGRSRSWGNRRVCNVANLRQIFAISVEMEVEQRSLE